MTHLPALDGVRGIGVLMVMCAHYYGLFGFASGSLGVDIFFVLSGFLITNLLLNEIEQTGSVRIGNFIARRALRLVPALVLAVLSFGLIDLIFQIRPMETTLNAMAGALVMYASNWIRAYNLFSMGEFGHTWSLAIEDQFYLVWPFALLVLTKASRPLAIATIVGAVVLVAANRYALLASGDVPIGYIEAATHTRMDALLVGAIPAFLMRYRINKTAIFYAACAGALAVLAVAVDPRDYLYKQPLVTVGVAAILMHLQANATSFFHQALSVNWLTYTGKISYGLYLYHYPIWFLTVHTFGGDIDPKTKQVICLFVLGPASFLVAWASYRFVEAPMLSLKRHFRAGASPTIKQPSTAQSSAVAS